MPQGKQASFFKCPINFREWFKIIMRGWSQHLTAKELAFVLFIFDRTFGWGKEWEIIRYSDMVGGRYGKDGRILAGVAVSSNASAIRLCKQLKAKGVIVTKRLRVGQMMALNYEWQPGRSANDCRITSGNDPQDIAKMKHHDIAKTHPLYKYPSGKRNAPQNKPSAGAEGGSSLEETILIALDRSKERREAKKAKASLRVEAIRKAMEDGCIAGNRKPFLLTAADAGALVSLGRRSGLSAREFLDRLQWIAEAWPLIIAAEFGWMTNPPTYPAPLFIVKQWNRLGSLWESRDGLAKEVSLSDREKHVRNLERVGVAPSVARRVARKVKDIRAGEQAEKVTKTKTNSFTSW